MEDLTDPFKRLQLKKALFAEEDSDEEDTLSISSWNPGLPNRISFSLGNISDENFYPSEVGKEMISRNHYQQVQAGNMLQNVTSCSSWAINSQHPLAENFECTVNKQCRELFLNYEDFTRTCSALKASTPKSSDGPFLLPSTSSVSKTKGTVLKFSCDDTRRYSALFPMLIYSETKALDPPNIVGSEYKKKTPTLDARDITENPSRAPSSSNGIQKYHSLDFPGGNDTTLRTSVKNIPQSLNAEDLWIVEPQALELDANGKGRLLLINKSSCRNLKFKIFFNGKLINVCPQSGNLKSKSRLGLRVIVTRCKNENPKEVIEDIIRVTCGNEEKLTASKLASF